MNPVIVFTVYGDCELHAMEVEQTLEELDAMAAAAPVYDVTDARTGVGHQLIADQIVLISVPE